MMTKPSRGDPRRDDEQQHQQQPDEERERGQPDPPGQMGVEVGPADLFDQARILLREALLDLLEDPLFVLAEGHPFPCLALGRGRCFRL